MGARPKGNRNHRKLKLFLNPLEQVADWLESYAKVMELNVWTSSTVTSAEKDASGVWIVNVTRMLPDGTEIKRVLRPVHLVLATGLGGGARTVPKFPKQVLRTFVLKHAALIFDFDRRKNSRVK